MLAATERFVRISLILGICILLATNSIARANELDYMFFQAQLAPVDIEAIEAKFQMTTRRPPLAESQVERIIPTLLPSLTGKTDVALLDRKDWEKINHKLEEIDREQQHSQDFISVARSGAGLRFSYYRDFNSVQDPYITFIAPSSDAKSRDVAPQRHPDTLRLFLTESFAVFFSRACGSCFLVCILLLAPLEDKATLGSDPSAMRGHDATGPVVSMLPGRLSVCKLRCAESVKPKSFPRL